MKLPKLLAAAFLSLSLYSCGCEDVNLGKLEFTNELITFLPADPGQGKSYYATFDGTRRQMNYLTPDDNATVVIPVKRISYSGKFDLNSCKEYYTAEQKVYTNQVEGGNPVSINITYRKDASQERFNDNIDKDNVADLIMFDLGYKNVFPEPIPSSNGTTKYDSYTTQRWFILDDATTSTVDHISYIQEFLPTVTLNGVEYENVYHFSRKEPNNYNPEDRFFLEMYPELDYIAGIYVKEGVGVIQAYSAKGKQIDITIE